MPANTVAEHTTAPSMGGVTNLHAAMANSADEGGPNREYMPENTANEPTTASTVGGPTNSHAVMVS